jgi:serine/threonine protein kinase
MVDASRSTPPMPQRIGRYQIEGVLGAGAMGAVYKGFDPLIKRTLAVKTLRLDIPRGSEEHRMFLERFHQEARICGTLSHPNIVTLFDIGEENGLPFLAFEFIEGETIESALSRKHKFKAEKVIGLISQIASALDYAHSKGVIHRDIKPANLLLFEEDKVKVTDFGIARLAESEMTRAGQMLGTPSYMSPEQAMGEKVDGRSDIFSLGVVAFEMLSGEQPFPGNNVTAILYRLVHGQPVEPANLEMNGLIPSKFHEVFGRVLAKDRAARYQTAADFVRDLELTLGSWFTGLEELAPVEIPPPPPVEELVVPMDEVEPAPSEREAPAASARPAAPLPPEDDEDVPETIAIPGAKKAEGAPPEEQEATVMLQGGSSPSLPPLSSHPPAASAPAGAPEVAKPASKPPTKMTLAGSPSRFGGAMKSGGLRIPPKTTNLPSRPPGSRPGTPSSRPPAPRTYPPQPAPDLAPPEPVPAPQPRAALPMGIVLVGVVALLIAGVAIAYFALRGSASGPTAGGGAATPKGRNSIEVQSQPAGARVRVNGQPQGTAPASVAGLAPGNYEVVVELDGHEPAAQDVTLKEGDAPAKVSLRLAPSKNAMVEADILSRPAGANVRIDGQLVGQTPLRGFKLRVGNRRIEIQTEGHAPWREYTLIEEGKENRVNALLQPSGAGGTR